MNYKKIFFIILFSLIVLSFARVPEQKTVSIKGVIKVYGSDPNTFIGLKTDEQKEYSLRCTPTIKKELRSLQGIPILFTGSIKKPVPQSPPLYTTLKDGTFELKFYTLQTKNED